MVKLNVADLEFILRQIKIAEANADGTPLTQIYVDALGNVVPEGTPGAVLAIPDPHVPYGLRTVDGTYNNIVEGRETWGAADTLMPRMLDTNFINEADGDTMALGPGMSEVTNTDYGVIGVPTNPFLPGTNGGHTGNVADADPRIISNLIVDMSVNNPAVVTAWFNNELAVAAWEEANPGKVPVPPGTVIAEGDTVHQALTNADLSLLPNIAPDEGLSAPFNAWMTFFGQFFDHGLDLITKGDNGTVFIPLQPDDPLITHGPDGIPDSGDEVPAHLAFMAVTRSTAYQAPGADGIMGTADDTFHEGRNTTTPYVDQNQTYTSHASHQVFLREYALDGAGRPVSTGRLLNSPNGDGLATWADVKAQARDMLGIELTDGDVLNVPLLRTDAYGKFIPDANGYAQVIVGLGADGIPNTDDDIVVSGTPGAPVNTFDAGAIRTGHAFLDDIAHAANPLNSQTGALKLADSDDALGVSEAGAYDDELLDRHFITGDGRGNENIGLTAVHHIFHSEHNRQIELQKLTILGSGDIDFINEWLLDDLAPGDPIPPADQLVWDGERLFQAARFATEMQYQHLVFEEFARKIQPNIDPFVFNSVTDINPAIFAEFANTVYRFGHSMLTDSMPRIFADGSSDDMGLIASFLNPIAFLHDADGNEISADEAAAALVRGLSREHGNAIDEFVVDALRNNLVGLPLDLAAINIARGRETGVPTLNEARAQLFAATGSTFLQPYDNWVEFAVNLKNSASVINFIAAYGTHASILAAETLADKRGAAMNIVFGNPDLSEPELSAWNAERAAFLYGDAALTGVNAIDLWIGGLAEKTMPFGGMLGSTFNAVFEAQLEALQDGDRFYYLTRTQGQNLLTELENNSFAKLIMANTALADPGADGIRGTADDVVSRHIGTDIFALYDGMLEVDISQQLFPDPEGNDPVLEAMGLGKVVRDNPATPQVETNYLRYFGGEHMMIGGTNDNDTIIGGWGDDAIWGDGGDDRIEAGAGVDLVNGGAGDDIITDSGDTGDFLKGDDGNDVIANSNGLDILMGGRGKDVFFVGVDATEVFGGEGDDFMLGGADGDFLIGGEGDDWMEGGDGFDVIAGDNSELFFNSAIVGHDVMFAGSDEQDFDAESGDDIMVQGESVVRNEGMFGFDWAIYKGVAVAADADLRIKIFTTEQADILRNRFDKVEALSGWAQNDVLRGDDRTAGDPALVGGVGANEAIFFNDGLDQAGIDRIAGLSQIVQVGANGFFEAGNILLGGAGSDMLQGNGGDDILDGDRWLNVRIRLTAPNAENTPANEIASIDSLKHVFAANDAYGNAVPSAWVGKSLFELMIDRVITPTQLHIVREVVTTGVAASDVDVALFNDVFANYTIIQNGDGSVTVRHDTVSAVIDPQTGRQLLSDGTDTLRNIEIARFADRDFSLVNSAPTGALMITGTENVLTANRSAVQDADGMPAANNAYSYQWQRSANGVDGWENVGTGTTFNTNNNQDFHRVIMTYTDLNGRVESVTSAITARVGTNGAETVDGNAGANLLNGRNGNDTINGLDGDDIINGGGGNDVLNGGIGNDTIFGGTGADTINGGEGDDVIVFDIDGNNGGSDVVSGGAGFDTLAIIDSGLGNETLNAVFNGTRITQVEGGGSIAADVESVTADLAGGTGDALVYSATSAAVTVDLGAGTASGFTSIANIENVTGTNNADVLTGNAANNALTGGSGNDTLTGGNGNDNINGGAGTDRAVFVNAATAHGFALNGANLVVTGAEGTDTLISIEQLQFGASVYSAATNTLVQGTNGNNNAINGGANSELILGFNGNDAINGNGGNDIIFGGTGTDTITAGAGDDTIVWNVGDGRDIVNGGADNDTVIINGNASNETFRVYTRAAWGAVGGNNLANLAAATEIVITRNGTNFNSVISELTGVEEIVINTGDGNDQVLTSGDFSPTSLSFNTIVINGSSGDDTVDISGLQSAHRILFRTNGGNDTIIGTLRDQDVIELPAGANLADYTQTVSNGVTTLSNGAHSIVFAGTGTLRVEGAGPSDDDAQTGAFGLTSSDVGGLLNLVRGISPDGDDDSDNHLGVRDLPGYDNNIDNPGWGAAAQPYIRVTDAHYGAFDTATGNFALNPIFDGLDTRDISNILAVQPENAAPAANVSAFFTAFGQYFDHGLAVLAKGGNGTVQIGAPGSGPGNPADLTRGTVAGIDPATGLPLHTNNVSPYVDQNQTYGSSALVGQLLRESDGNQGFGSHILMGGPDPSNPDFDLLPTLRTLLDHHIAAGTVFKGAGLPPAGQTLADYYPSLVNGDGSYDAATVSALAADFMGEGFALLLDVNPYINLLDHVVAGDGRANENIALTAMHTIFARNHNFHVAALEVAGFPGTTEELFQAAKILNETEYQRVVFDEFLPQLLGGQGIRGDSTHGFDDYNPEANAGISHEFASAAYRFGHTLVTQMLSVVGEGGALVEVPLFDAYLNPTNAEGAFTMPLATLAQYGYVPQPGYSEFGAGAILAGITTQPAEEVDVHVVDAVRNDLVRISADLFALNVARGRDVGLGTLNQVRAELAASSDPYISEAVGYAGDLSPYTSWQDFQTRNGLSDTAIAEFMQAYPDLVLPDAATAAVFSAINASTPLVDNGDGTFTVLGIDRVDLYVGGLAEKHAMGGIVGQTFWVLLHEQLDRLQEGDRFYYIPRLENFDFYQNFVEDQTFAGIVARNTGLTGLGEAIFVVADANSIGGAPQEPVVNETPEEPVVDETPEEPVVNETPEDPVVEGEGEPAEPLAASDPFIGTSGDDMLIGSAGADLIMGFGGVDHIVAGAGADVVRAGEGNDFVDGGAGRDVIFGEGGDDDLFGGDDDDIVYGDAGNDRIFGGNGNDLLNGGAGDDIVFGGAGDDVIVAELNDGDDTYYGDDASGGSGIDLLDMGMLTVDATVDLGNGVGGRGSAMSTQTGSDTLWHIENVVTGSGNDVIIASASVNVMDGGSGDDLFVFLSAAAADGDTIRNFEPGDKIDLSGIDADTGAAGNQAFTLVAGSEATAPGQLVVTHETREDGEYTVISGNTGCDETPEFRINIAGNHTLSASDFTL